MHPHFANRVVCGLNGCPATPSSFEALRRHMYRYHKDLLNISSTSTSSLLHGDGNNADQDENEFQPNDINEVSAVHRSPTIIGAEYILKIRDGKKLTQATIDEIINDTKIVIQNTIDIIKKKVTDKTQGLISDDQLAEIRDIFHDESLVNPFGGLETEYQQEQFISSNFMSFMINFIIMIMTILTYVGSS